MSKSNGHTNESFQMENGYSGNKEAEAQKDAVEGGSFWQSRMCKLVGVGGCLVLVGAAIALIVCAAGGCSEGSPCNLNCDDGKWGYLENDGAECWGKCWDLCEESFQSPIDLETATAEDIDVDPLVMVNYNDSQGMAMSNNGHTVSVSLSGASQISGLGLPSTYQAYQFHLHWGQSSSSGSEHTINGRMYPLELHIVHYNTDYPSPDDAADQPQGLAVLGFMFTETPEDNMAYDPIVSKLEDIKYKDSPEVNLGNLRLDELIPEEQRHFYRYAGSLTTPPCFQSVVWTVFNDVIEISEKQLSAFRKLYTGTEQDRGDQIEFNWRPTQPRNNRKLQFGTNFQNNPFW